MTKNHILKACKKEKNSIQSSATRGSWALEKTLLFDICGVLYDVSGGNRRMLEWLGDGVSEQQMLGRWVLSEPVRRVELGEISMEEFARGVIEDLRFPVDADTFLREYDSWHKGPYKGAVELVRDLSKKYVTASFSNISEFQWSKIRKTGIVEHVKFNFASFEIGYVKPDREAFAYVIGKLGRRPSEICFFDDNQTNVDAANEMGIRSYMTRGLGELRDRLLGLGVLP
jgi:HAD superfamily hydrolase (TIGR01509 family)